MRFGLRKTLTLALGLCLGLTLWAATPSGVDLLAQSEALVRPSPAELQMAEGETATVEVLVEDVEGLYGLDIRLGYDASIVEVVDANPDSNGIQLRPGDLLNLDFVVKNEADNEEGTTWFAMTQLNPSEAVSGSGTAFSITFRGKRAGSTPLSITYTQLATRSGEEIPASTEDGEIRVVSSDEASPEATEASSQPSTGATPATPQPTGPQPTLVTVTPTATGAANAVTGTGTATPEPTAQVNAPTAEATAAGTMPEGASSPSPRPAGTTSAAASSPSPTTAEADVSTATPTSIVVAEAEETEAPQSPAAPSSNTRTADGGSGPSTTLILAGVVGVLGAALLVIGIRRLAKRRQA